MATHKESILKANRILEAAGVLLPLSNALVHAVPNGVRGDSRVLKCALASAASGHTTVILGVTPQPEPEAFVLEGIAVLLIPVGVAPAKRAPIEQSRKSALGGRLRRFKVVRLAAGARRRLRRVVATARGSAPAPAAAPARRSVAAQRKVLAIADGLSVLRPRVIHAHDVLALPGAISFRADEEREGRRVRVIYDAHECIPELVKSFADSPAHQALGAFERQYCAEADVVVTVSPEIANLLKREYQLDRVPLVVTNGPSVLRDAGAPSLRERVGVPPEVPLVVYSGWIATDRGLGTVVRALVTLPDVHLALVVGQQNAALKEVLKLANDLGVRGRVHLAPYVPPAQITQYLSSATVGLLPLMPGEHFAHSLPTKFREYALAGLPLVVSNHDTMAREIDRTGIGLTFKAGSVAGLRKHLREVVDDPNTYASKITPQLLETYAWESQVGTLSLAHGEPTGQNATALIAGLVSASAALNTVVTTPSTTKQGSLDVWLGIGRANSASQAYLWAEAARSHLGIPAESFGVKRAVCLGPHVVVPKSPTGVEGAREFSRVLDAYTYLLVDGFKPLFGAMLRRDLEPELELLAIHTFGLGLVSHGSDTRDPDRHMSDVAGSFFAVADPDWTQTARELARRNREIATTSGLPTFVSTPDLLNDLPDATWLPLAVEVDAWGALRAARFPKRLRVLHRPSREHPPIKGTDVIDPVLERLHDEGLIEYVRTAGIVSREAMPELVAKVDVVVDQIRTGSFGVAAIEAMAAGRVVVGAVDPATRARVGFDLPILDAPPHTFEQAMRDLVADDRAHLEARAEQGRIYAREMHDGAASARVIESQFLRLAR